MLIDIKNANESIRSIERGRVKEIEKKTASTGKTFFSITIMDKTATITGNAFNAKDDVLQLAGKVVELEVRTKDGYVNFDKIREAVGEDPHNYVRCGHVSPDQGMRYVTEKIDSMTDQDLKAVTQFLVMKNEEDFKTMAAGKSMHHDYLYGLITHTSGILAMGMAAVKIHPHLDRNLMIAGIILHDIGKVREMKTDEFATTEYTLEGTFFGHLLIGVEMIDDACRELGIDPKGEKIMMLKHMIASHHGKMEYGAVKAPLFAEAWALSALDDFDAKMDMFRQAGAPKGGMSDQKLAGIGYKIYGKSF